MQTWQIKEFTQPIQKQNSICLGVENNIYFVILKTSNIR